MISTALFNKSEAKLLHLVNLWNASERKAHLYDTLFVSNPHELVDLIKQGTTFHDWQMFLADSRVQDYIDRIIYTQAGILINKLMDENISLKVSDATKLNTAIKYRDDHRADFAVPVQYIYIGTPLTPAEREFLPDVPENKKAGI